jgi:ribosomal protein S18 acetylase RimI-like enzyme
MLPRNQSAALAQPAPRSYARLRQAHSDDVDALLALETDAFSTDRLSRRSFQRLVGAGQVVLVAEQDGRVAGYVLVLVRAGSDIGRLYSLAVAADGRGAGLGRDLLAAAERAAAGRRCRRMRLEVAQSNAAAAHLYRSAGYSEIARLPDYYQDGSAAVRFEKRLSVTE